MKYAWMVGISIRFIIVDCDIYYFKISDVNQSNRTIYDNLKSIFQISALHLRWRRTILLLEIIILVIVLKMEACVDGSQGSLRMV